MPLYRIQLGIMDTIQNLQIAQIDTYYEEHIQIKTLQQLVK